MIAVTLPALLAALAPVIWIEAHYSLRRLGLPYRRALAVSAVGNAASTVIGVPIAWAVLAGLETLSGGFSRTYQLGTLSGKLLAVTWQSPWLYDYRDDLRWMVPAAALCLLVPFFLASVCIEYQVARRMLSPHPRSTVLAAVWRANLLSYGLLAVLATAWLIRGLLTCGSTHACS